MSLSETFQPCNERELCLNEVLSDLIRAKERMERKKREERKLNFDFPYPADVPISIMLTSTIDTVLDEFRCDVEIA